VDRSDLAARIAHAGVRLAVVLLAPLAVALLRLLPPLQLTADGAPVWLATAVAGVASGILALATVLALARGLRDGHAASLGDAAGLGALAAGLAVAALHALEVVAEFPDRGLATAAIIGGALLLVPRALPAAAFRGWAARVAAGVLVFMGVEAALAGAIFLAASADAGPWLFAGASALAAASALQARSTSLGLLAGGLAALAATRTGSMDTIAALIPLGAAGFGIAWTSAVQLLTWRADGIAADELAAGPPPLLPWPASRDPSAPEEEESTRLARELRGTIEELLETRRTIELQRVEIARAATTDPLTGVATRRSILERLRVEAAEARRYTHPLALLLLDVDGFARLNHEHGLAVGDAVLRELALRMRLRIRAADALGRAGGDSFLAILPHTDERGAAAFAEALRRRLTTRPVSSEAGELTVGVSIGVAFVRPGMTLSDEELLVAADEALASAKAAGGNRIAFDRLHGLARLENRRTESEPVEEVDKADAGDTR
jgi:diguanylate cyclase (GGDEF)-like protein